MACLGIATVIFRPAAAIMGGVKHRARRRREGRVLPAFRDEQEQAMTIKRHPAIGPSDMAAIEVSLANGASRRDLMRWLGAAGLSAATAGVIIGDAGRARAQTPKRGGRIKVASQTSSTADTVDPAKQINQTDYTPCFTFS